MLTSKCSSIISTIRMIEVVILALLPLECFTETIGVQNRSFVINGSFTGVVFSPFVRHIPNEEPNAYSEEDIGIMLQVISRRFSHIMTLHSRTAPPQGSDWEGYHSSLHIPRVAANLNKNKLGVYNDSSSKLNVIITVQLYEDADLNETIASMQLAMKLATEANQIYPKTVSTVMLDVEDIQVQTTLEKCIQVFNRIPSSNNTHNSSAAHDFLIERGIWLQMKDCSSYNVESLAPIYTQKVLAYVDTVIFHKIFLPAEYEDGPKKTFEAVKAEFMECKKKLRRTFKDNLNIFLSTGWSSKGPTHGHTTLNQVTFWKLLSEWAAQQKSLVYLSEAFDIPRRNKNDLVLAHRGWWRLRNADIINVTKTVFVEKVFADSLEEVEKIKKSSFSVIYIVLITLCVGLGTILVAIVLIYLYKRNFKTSDARQRLSEEDYGVFMRGGQDNILGPGYLQGESCTEVLRQPYKKSVLELPKTSFRIDRTALLGAGAFGSVYKGRINGNENEVAFKTTQPSCPIITLKGLLSEIKVLSYLGKHEHVLTLVGAYTAELRSGTVYVVTELCEAGSLEKFLRLQQYKDGIFLGNLSERTDTEAKQGFKGQADMLRWSYEIASGMEYITSRNVVHADLATRNVLLSADLTAKISDFGLSRRLYDYTNYVKQQQEPLPWRWMSIEALKSLEFSEKSDIWAFGCTMWEIYSLGDVPYPGLSWNLEFVEELINGLRLQRPSHATQEIYELMNQCWHLNPSDRTPFIDLKNTLLSLINQTKTE